MKYKSSFFATLFVSCIFAFGQNPKQMRISFDYIQPPQVLLSSDFKYSSSGSVTYEEEVLMEKAENDVAMEEWNSLSMTKKLKRKSVDGSNLPYNKYFPTIHSSDRLTSFVSIEGLNKSQDAKASVNLIINRPIVSSSSRKIKVAQENGTNVTRFKAVVSTSTSIEAIITDARGNI